MTKTLAKAFALTVAVSSFLSLSCGADQTAENASNTNKIVEIPEPERLLSSLRTADFDFIYSIKRKDDEAFSEEDKDFLSEKTYRANRRRLTKDEKILFIGTNYRIAEKDLDAVRKRFEFADFSKPASERKSEKSTGKETNQPAKPK